jgi:hypothetical protein
MPPEWVLLLVGCLLGVSSGISVVIFDKGVSMQAGVLQMGLLWIPYTVMMIFTMRRRMPS